MISGTPGRFGSARSRTVAEKAFSNGEYYRNRSIISLFGIL